MRALFAGTSDCAPVARAIGRGKTLDLAPLQEPTHVNIRRAALGLMRLEIYVKLVRLHSPDLCGALESPK